MLRNTLVLIRNVIYGIYFLPFIIYYHLIYKKKKVIFCECYMSKSIRFNHNNWGDDLNHYFFEYASNVKVINLPFSKMMNIIDIRPYSLIGSVLGFYKLNNKIIYGSGIQDPDIPIKFKPERIISVRGPRTRIALLKNKIECPEKYGDPALLLPCFYTPKVSKKRRGGLILNMGSNIIGAETTTLLATKMDLEIISMTNYDKWTDIIDKICSCEYVVSESLHGLIVSETYGIPNVWVEVIRHPAYWDFKFIDYYESIGKNETIISVVEKESIDSMIQYIYNKLHTWEKGNVNYKALLEMYPF